jgi:transposase-like protein
MSHRIREAMRCGDLAPFGGNGGTVEVDETFIGNNRTIKPYGVKKGRGYAHKHKMLSLVDRRSGRVRSIVVDDLKASTVVPILRENIAKEAQVYTDEASYYAKQALDFAGHDFVRHGQGEYGRGVIHTNIIEGFFSIFKRGMKGVYQHCGKKHLHRYMAEFDFRYTNRKANGIEDSKRADIALLGIVGKRLTYQTIGV